YEEEADALVRHVDKGFLLVEQRRLGPAPDEPGIPVLARIGDRWNRRIDREHRADVYTVGLAFVDRHGPPASRLRGVAVQPQDPAVDLAVRRVRRVMQDLFRRRRDEQVADA